MSKSELITLPTFHGLTVNGVYKGTRVQRSKPDANGQSKDTIFAGVAIEAKNAYGTTEQIIEIVISSALVTQGLPAKLHALTDQLVSFPVWQSVWTGTKRSGVTLYMSNEVTDIF
jgi:hypothetical protein